MLAAVLRTQCWQFVVKYCVAGIVCIPKYVRSGPGGAAIVGSRLCCIPEVISSGACAHGWRSIVKVWHDCSLLEVHYYLWPLKGYDYFAVFQLWMPWRPIGDIFGKKFQHI